MANDPNKPPFDLGSGWLDWADKKAAQIFSAIWDGVADYFNGRGRVAEMAELQARNHPANHPAQGHSERPQTSGESESISPGPTPALQDKERQHTR